MTLTKRQHQLQVKILNVIYTAGSISRIDIANKTNITPATVSQITANLIDQKLIQELGEENPEQLRSGRKKILLTIAPNYCFYIGIELSEKFFSFGLCDNLGTIIDKKIIYACDYHGVLSHQLLVDELQLFLQESQPYHPQAIGFALPGHFDQKNSMIQTNNVFWTSFYFEEIIATCKLPTYFKNNVDCMTIAERLFTYDLKEDNFTFLHVGRGMFCTHMYQGILYGTNHIVGEIGHTIVHPDGELCECGKRGCLQTYVSEAWIIKKSQLLFDNSNTTYLRQLSANREAITIETIHQAYQLGDAGIINILHHAIKYLAITINNSMMMIDSDKTIIHGQLFDEPQLFVLLKENIDTNNTILFSEKKHTINIKKYTPLNGAIGACGLCVDQALLT